MLFIYGSTENKKVHEIYCDTYKQIKKDAKTVVVLHKMKFLVC